jgi:hypothetical protein
VAASLVVLGNHLGGRFDQLLLDSRQIAGAAELRMRLQKSTLKQVVHDYKHSQHLACCSLRYSRCNASYKPARCSATVGHIPTSTQMATCLSNCLLKMHIESTGCSKQYSHSKVLLGYNGKISCSSLFKPWQ